MKKTRKNIQGIETWVRGGRLKGMGNEKERGKRNGKRKVEV